MFPAKLANISRTVSVLLFDCCEETIPVQLLKLRYSNNINPLSHRFFFAAFVTLVGRLY